MLNTLLSRDNLLVIEAIKHLEHKIADLLESARKSANPVMIQRALSESRGINSALFSLGLINEAEYNANDYQAIMIQLGLCK